MQNNINVKKGKTPEGVCENTNNFNLNDFDFAIKLEFENGTELSFKTDEDANNWFNEKIEVMNNIKKSLKR